MTFPTATKATRDSLKRKGQRRSSSVVGRRADRLIRNLRNVFAAQDGQQAGTSAPAPYGYGLAQVQTERVFRKRTNDGRLHLVDVIAADEIDGVLAYLLLNTTSSGSQAVVFPGPFPGQQGTSGSVTGEITSGRFKNNGSQIILRDGAPGQTAINDLINNVGLDSNFKGTGIAYIYSRWTFIDGRFSGDPDIEVIARLRKPVDPRGGTPRWSINPYVQLYDFLTKSKDIGGAGLSPDRLALDTFIDGANWADMLVDTQSITRTAILTTDTNKAAANHLFEFDQTVAPFAYGDVVQLVANSGQTLPPNFSPGVDYHVISVRHRFGDFQVPAIALAANLNDALDGIFITAGTRSTDIDIKKVRETRYMTGFSYRSNESRLTIAQEMLESCGAFFYDDNGKIAITRQTFPAEVLTVTDNEIRPGELALSPRRDSSERATAISGSFTGVLNLFEPKDFPRIDGGGAFIAADNGREVTVRFNLPKVGKVGAAQRLTTIRLRRIRQELLLTFSGSLSLFRLKPGEVFSLDFEPFGLDSNTTFEVRDQVIFFDQDDTGGFVGIDIVARQLEATTFDLDVSAEQVVSEASIPGLQSPFDVGKPGTPQIAEDLFVSNQGGGVKALVTMTWAASQDSFIETYRPAYKLASSSTFRPLPPGPETEVTIEDIKAGLYDFRVIAVNTLGLESEPSTVQKQIFALSAPPADPTGLFGQQQAEVVLLEWDLSEDLDVRFGGQVDIRHQVDIAGGKGGDSRQLALVDGNLKTYQVPFLRGTYYIRFIDQTGNSSQGFDEWSTDELRAIPFGQTIVSGAFQANDGSTENQITLSESPTFPSTNGSNTMVEDTGNQWITLPLEGGIDSITDIDTVTNIDDIPAGNSVAPEGVWFFDAANNIELTAKERVIFEAVLETEIVDIASGIDSIPNIDDVPNIDAVGAGTAQIGQADAWLEVRYSTGTIASDTFGPWERFDVRRLFHRSFEFRVQARSLLSTVNIRVKQAAVIARELNFDR